MVFTRIGEGKRIVDVVPLAVVVDHLLNDESVRGTVVGLLPIPRQDVGAVLGGWTLHFACTFRFPEEQEARQQEECKDVVRCHSVAIIHDFVWKDKKYPRRAILWPTAVVISVSRGGKG
jgi:hypothetical protein